MNVDYFDLYHVVVKNLPWPEEVQKWGEVKPSHQHALDALRKLGSQGVSAADKMEPLINRVLDAMKTGPAPAVQRAGVPEVKMETPHKSPVLEPDWDKPEPVAKPLPEPKASKSHH